ncbi:MAG TPA: hypothetical protein VNA30_00685 [Mycobacteriales bacterium]|nr:hypothetical protein [Mycobacteriales bacterium]
MAELLLARESALLVQRLRLWTPARWAAAAEPWGTRADVVHHLAQAFADEAAEREGEPSRPLPRLPNDLALPDQLAVVAADLVATGLTTEEDHRATAHLLRHRGDLLGETTGPLDPAAIAAGCEDSRSVR